MPTVLKENGGVSMNISYVEIFVGNAGTVGERELFFSGKRSASPVCKFSVAVRSFSCSFRQEVTRFFKLLKWSSGGGKFHLIGACGESREKLYFPHFIGVSFPTWTRRDFFLHRRPAMPAGAAATAFSLTFILSRPQSLSFRGNLVNFT